MDQKTIVLSSQEFTTSKEFKGVYNDLRNQVKEALNINGNFRLQSGVVSLWGFNGSEWIEIGSGLANMLDHVKILKSFTSFKFKTQKLVVDVQEADNSKETTKEITENNETKEKTIKQLELLESDYFSNYSAIPDNELNYLDSLGRELDVDLLEYAYNSDEIIVLISEYERLKQNIYYFTDVDYDEKYLKLSNQDLNEFNNFVSQNNLDLENDYCTLDGYGFYMKLTRFDLWGYVSELLEALEKT